MSDFLTNLLNRIHGRIHGEVTSVQPRLGARFEPSPLLRSTSLAQPGAGTGQPVMMTEDLPVSPAEPVSTPPRLHRILPEEPPTDHPSTSTVRRPDQPEEPIAALSVPGADQPDHAGEAPRSGRRAAAPRQTRQALGRIRRTVAVHTSGAPLLQVERFPGQDNASGEEQTPESQELPPSWGSSEHAAARQTLPATSSAPSAVRIHVRVASGNALPPVVESSTPPAMRPTGSPAQSALAPAEGVPGPPVELAPLRRADLSMESQPAERPRPLPIPGAVTQIPSNGELPPLRAGPIMPRRAVEPDAQPLAASPAPAIRVTIGRVEVRATPPPSPPANGQHVAPQPSLSLDAYLKRRGGGR